MTTISQEALGKRKSYFSGAAAATYSNNKKCNKKKKKSFFCVSKESMAELRNSRKKTKVERKKID